MHLSLSSRVQRAALACALVALAGYRFTSHTALAQSGPRATATPQKLDEDYTSRIKKATPDPRIITELVDHMPASATVPSPLKFFGYVPGEPGHMTYHADIVRYYEALQKASPRVKLFKIGQSEEGRDMVALAIADEATIKQLDKYKQITAKLTDPRKLQDAEAKQLIATGKPIYYATGSIHSPETGSPEMLAELAFRLAVEESEFVRTIRNNSIVLLTPASEVDGREKAVDNFNFGLKHPGEPAPGMVYWGKYVQHDNNRDGIGVGLKLTQNMLRNFLDWHPTVFHDLHESVTLLHVSTGTGPYNTVVDPIQVDEWWLLAQNDMLEMTKRGVPGVWTYNYYDGWVPNYMFWIGVTHNSIGRFYETQSFVGQNRPLGPVNQSREWYRPNPTPNDINWGPRANVNMQESAILISMNNVAKNHATFLENYYVKNKHTVERGATKAPYAYVIPAAQRRRVEAAGLMNLIREEGAEVHTANSASTVGGVKIAAGDYIVRMDQPYAAVCETLLGVQYYAPENPRPYDDTGWSIPLLRNLTATAISDKAILSQPMTLATADFTVPGTIAGTGGVIVVDHTTDNTLVTFRFQHASVKMSAAEQAFDAGGHHFAAGAFVIANADRAALEPSIKALGLSAWAMAAAPSVPMHDLDVPRIGYIHTWTSTQDEGWVRMALDNFKVPYTYFADNLVRQGNLRQKYDVIIFPHAGGNGASLVYGGVQGNTPRPYKTSADTPHLGLEDSTDDMRGGLGYDGLQELYKFVSEGGVLITEGSTSTIFPDFNLTQGIRVEESDALYARGSVLKAVLGDKTSPVLYGYDQSALAVYFNQGPIFAIGGAGGGRGGGRGAGPEIQGIPNMQPNAVAPHLTTLQGGEVPAEDVTGANLEPAGGRGGRGGRGAGGAQGRGFGRGGNAGPQPRILLSFPTDPNDLLLSGVLFGGEAIAGHPVAVDAPVGKGHVVMFANRPYWRWETQGNFFLGFNAILNWDHLDAGARGLDGEPGTLMTRRSLGGAVIAVTVLACAVIAAEQPPALLRYHWVKGGVTHYRMTLKSDILMSGLPGGMADIHVDQTMAQDIGIAIDDVAADGTATTTQSFDAMKVEMQGPMGTMTFDSAHPEKNGKDPLSAAMGRLFGAMVGRALVVQMASDGAILKVTGASKMLDALRSSAGDDPTFAAAVKVMAGMMDDDAMRNLLAQSFSRLPQKPVGVGDTWTGSMTLNAAAGSPTATSTMSLTSFDGPPDTGLAHIAVSVTMQQGAPVAAPGGATVTIGATKGDGEIVFDVGQGRIERSRMRVDSPASTTAAGPNGPMTLETRTTTTMNMERIDSAAAVSKAPDASGRIQ